MKYIYILLISLVFLSCNSNIKKYYYSTGELFSVVELNDENKNHGRLRKMYKTGELEAEGSFVNGLKDGCFKVFYKSGKLKAIESYRKGLLVDTSKAFYENGKLSILKYYNNESNLYQKKKYENGITMSEGKMKDSIRLDWWNYYDNKGYISKKADYLLINNKQYLNQLLVYNSKGEIVKDSSNYYQLSFPDTIMINKSVTGKLKLQPLLSKKNDFHMVYFNFLDSNNKIILIDSTYGKNNKEAVLWGKFKYSGVKKLEGYILEKKLIQKINKKDTSMVDIFNLEHKMYFEKKIYVIDDKKVNNLNKKLVTNKG